MRNPALTAPDERILLAIGRMHYLTNEQLRRLYYGQSLSYVQERTRKLAQLGYLLRLELKSARRGGSSPIVYSLDRIGRSFVEEAGYSLPSRFRKSEILAASPMHLEHTLAVNDVLIAFEQLQGSVSLLEYWHERDIKRMSLPVYPDAWIAVRDGDLKTAYLLEVDRGTEKQVAFRDRSDGSPRSSCPIDTKRLLAWTGSTVYWLPRRIRYALNNSPAGSVWNCSSNPAWSRRSV